MTCSHARGIAGWCLECFFDRLADGSASTAIQEVTSTLFSPEGRAQRLVTKLLWRTAFLKRCTEVLGSQRSPEMSLKLLELVARMFAEELLGSASISCGVARPNHKGDVDGMLLDALVAHIDHQCRSEAPGVLLLFQLLENILEACGAAPDVREALCRRIQSSKAIVSALVSSMTLETEMDISEESGALLLRLLERGGHEFLAPLAQNCGRIARALAEAKPSSQRGTTLLALYRMCALHQSLLSALLLSGDVTSDAESIAVGLSRHLASSEGALMAAAAELVEDLGAIFIGEDVQVEGWLRKAQLAQWLIECLRRGDLSARCAACRALRGQLPLDDQLRPLHAVAADALMDACGDALSLASSGAERQQLLQAAAEALERLNREETCGLFAPQKLIPLLRAAKDLSQEGSLSLDDCLAPVCFCMQRPMDVHQLPQHFYELFEVAIELAAQQDLKGHSFVSEMLSQLMVMLCNASWMHVSASSNFTHLTEREGHLGDIALLIHFAQKLGGIAKNWPLPDLVVSLAAALWPVLDNSANFNAEQVISLKNCCLQLSFLVPQLFDVPLFEELQGAEVVLNDNQSAGQLLSVLLVPYLMVDGTSLSLLVPSHELFSSCQLLLDGLPFPPPNDGNEAVVLGALLAAAESSASLGEMALERLVAGDLPLLPLRSVVSLTCAVCRVTAASTSPHTARLRSSQIATAAATLRRGAARSMQGARAQEEWRQLKVPGDQRDAIHQGPANLTTALGFLLASAEDMEEARDILLGAVVLEDATGMIQADGSRGDWQWLADCLPSPRWMAQNVEVLLGHALQEDVACGMLTLMSSCLTDSKAAALMASNHAIAGLAMRWQRSAEHHGTSELVKCIGLFMLQQLAATPGDALQHSPLLALLAETLQCNPSAALVPELAVLAFYRAWDVPKLRQDEKGPATLSGPRLNPALLDRLERAVEQDSMDTSTNGICDSTIAWALVTSSLLLTGSPLPTSTVKPSHSRCEDASSTAFRLLAVSCAYLRCPLVVEQRAHDAQSLAVLVRGCSDLLFSDGDDASDWNARVTDAAALAVLGLLSSVQPLTASETLHSERVSKSLHAAVERLLLLVELGEGGTAEEPGVPEERLQRCFTGPCLLLLILLLRSETGWLKDSDISRIRPFVRTLARSKSCMGAQRLLLLRLAEELVIFQNVSGGSECHQVVLKQLLAEQRLWDLATQELRELACQTLEAVAPVGDVVNGFDEMVISEDSDEELDLMSLQQQARKWRMAEGSRLPKFRSVSDGFQQLHLALCRRLCATLALPGQN